MKRQTCRIRKRIKCHVKVIGPAKHGRILVECNGKRCTVHPSQLV